jgi:hypothetical protein
VICRFGFQTMMGNTPMRALPVVHAKPFPSTPTSTQTTF